MNGMDVFTLQKMLRHKKLTITELMYYRSKFVH